jgi:hypothetical protein
MAWFECKQDRVSVVECINFKAFSSRAVFIVILASGSLSTIIILLVLVHDFSSDVGIFILNYLSAFVGWAASYDAVQAPLFPLDGSYL